ncbi:hypothetical protein PSHT_14275 [Puccinia striiformis]|uniref:Uncharacterized protein n=1 Tax=Puccinia striiformis TaxID=27350 RepID=A0A2S4ULA8_9BASI|nr:hypothetical protein PSHT_14275 [Puccinia striiformis]
MSSCAKCSQKTNFIALGQCLPCLEDAGFTQSKIEDSLCPASTVPQKSNIPKQPTKSNPIFPFASASLQSRSVTRTIPLAIKSVIPTSSSARSLPSTHPSIPDDRFENLVKKEQRKTQVVPISRKKLTSSSLKAKASSKATADDEEDAKRIIVCETDCYRHFQCEAEGQLAKFRAPYGSCYSTLIDILR